MSGIRLEDIDPNFAAKTYSECELEFYDVTNKPFKVYGLYNAKQGDFSRMPHDIAHTVSKGVEYLQKQTSGGRIRFKTNSRYIVVKSILPEFHLMKHMPFTGSSSFDLYIDNVYYKPFFPDVDFQDSAKCKAIASSVGIESMVDMKNNEVKEIEINFPLYNAVSNVYIGLEKEALVEEGKEYIGKNPVVFYGSSITQGGCASHPGNAYQNIISRRLNRDFINLGFSGSCKAEKEMAEYISSLDMDAFVYDYDHNSPSAEYLEQTHEPLFLKLREKNPDVPVIFVSTADRSFGDKTDLRKSIIYKTYKNALDRGDKNVYFIDGQTIYNEVDGQYCTVDGCHPNDLGFWCMANSICDVLKKIF